MKKRESGISKNLLAILLVVAIIVSCLGTIMTIYNLSNAKTYTIFKTVGPPSVGKVGISVTEPKNTTLGGELG